MIRGPRPQHRPRAVIFDMDGLMLDTERLAPRAWSEAACAVGVEFDLELCAAMIGRNFADCQAIVIDRYGESYPTAELMHAWHVAYDAIIERDGIALKPGLLALLDWLARESIPKAVATSTRRERAQRLREERKDFFDQYGPEARGILGELLEKYAEHGTAQFVLPDVLKVPPISERGNVIEIAKMFGGSEKLRDAVNQLQTLLYAA